MSRAKEIVDAVTKGLDEHYRMLDDPKKRMSSLKVLLRMREDGHTPDKVFISPEFVKDLIP
jgi:hypothetical protein